MQYTQYLIILLYCTCIANCTMLRVWTCVDRCPPLIPWFLLGTLWCWQLGHWYPAELQIDRTDSTGTMSMSKYQVQVESYILCLCICVSLTGLDWTIIMIHRFILFFVFHYYFLVLFSKLYIYIYIYQALWSTDVTVVLKITYNVTLHVQYTCIRPSPSETAIQPVRIMYPPSARVSQSISEIAPFDRNSSWLISHVGSTHDLGHNICCTCDHYSSVWQWTYDAIYITIVLWLFVGWSFLIEASFSGFF